MLFDKRPRLQSFGLPDPELATFKKIDDSIGNLWSLAENLDDAIYIVEQWRSEEVEVAQKLRSFRAEASTTSGPLITDFSQRDVDRIFSFDAQSRRCRNLAAVGARDATLSLWNFGDGLKILTEICRGEGKFLNRIDRSKLVLALEKFHSLFPSTLEMRNHICHRFESASNRPNKNRIKQNKIRKQYLNLPDMELSPGTYVSNSFIGNMMILSHSGAMHELEIDRSLFEKVISVCKIIEDAFAAATVAAVGWPTK